MMMSVPDQEIIEKFRQLPPAAKQRVLALIEKELTSEHKQVKPFDYAALMRGVETLRQQVRANHADKMPPADVVGMLRDIRDGEDE